MESFNKVVLGVLTWRGEKDGLPSFWWALGNRRYSYCGGDLEVRELDTPEPKLDGDLSTLHPLTLDTAVAASLGMELVLDLIDKKRRGS